MGIPENDCWYPAGLVWDLPRHNRHHTAPYDWVQKTCTYLEWTQTCLEHFLRCANVATAGWLFSFLHDWVCSNQAVQCCCCREAQCRHLSPLQQGAMQLPIANDTAKQVDCWFILFVVCKSMQKWHSWLFNWIVFKISFKGQTNMWTYNAALHSYFYFFIFCNIGCWASGSDAASCSQFYFIFNF